MRFFLVFLCFLVSFAFTVEKKEIDKNSAQFTPPKQNTATNKNTVVNIKNDNEADIEKVLKDKSIKPPELVEEDSLPNLEPAKDKRNIEELVKTKKKNIKKEYDNGFSKYGFDKSKEPVYVGDINFYRIKFSSSYYFKRGWNLALNEINMKGGVLDNRPLVVVSENSMDSSFNTAEIMQKMYRDLPISAIMGGISKETSDVMALSNIKYHIPIIFVSDNNDIMTVGKYKNPYNLKLTSSIFAKTYALAKEVSKSNLNSFVVIRYMSGNGQYISDITKSTLTNLLKKNASEKTKGKKSKEKQKKHAVYFFPDIKVASNYARFSKVIEQIKNTDAKALIITIEGEDLNSLIQSLYETKTLKRKRLFILFPSASQYQKNLAITKYPAGTIGVYFPYFNNKESKIVEFIKLYQTLYPSEVSNYYAALGYVTLYILKDAINKAGSDEPKDILKQLKKMDFETLFGKINFTRGDNQSNMDTYTGVIDFYKKRYLNITSAIKTTADEAGTYEDIKKLIPYLSNKNSFYFNNRTEKVNYK